MPLTYVPGGRTIADRRALDQARLDEIDNKMTAARVNRRFEHMKDLSTLPMKGPRRQVPRK